MYNGEVWNTHACDNIHGECVNDLNITHRILRFAGRSRGTEVMSIPIHRAVTPPPIS